MFSSSGNEHKTFKKITRERLLREMLQSTKTRDSKSMWKVLIVDKFTIKIISSTCKMTDITMEGVSLVEDISRPRQPFPFMDAIYFIQPSKDNISMLLSDMAEKKPLYRNSPMAEEVVNHIYKNPIVPHRITLREINLEYFAVDSQGFITGNETALEDLFVDAENTCKGDACLNVMATRIATVFASLKEFPFVRYRAAKSLDAATMTTYPDLIPTKLAAGVWNNLVKYQKTIPNFPQIETCELLILDRSVDQIAPIIHEWFYDAMCHDLLSMEGNKYVHEVPIRTGDLPETKEVLLEEHDPIWLELRYAHIADASERLHEQMNNFIVKNSAAKILGSRVDGEVSTQNLRKMVQAIPEYSKQIDKLSLHVEIAGKIYRSIEQLGLKKIGQLEQDLVFGYAGMKDVIKILNQENLTRENKLRLLMILSAIYPEKLEGEKGLKLMKLAKLSAEDMKVVNNMKLIGGSLDTQQGSTRAFSLKFDIRKMNRVARKERTDAKETWQLSRFYPVIEELIEKLSKGELSKNDYPCMNGSSATVCELSLTSPINRSPAHSVRSGRVPTWAQHHNSGHGYSSDSILGHASSSNLKMGQRIFVFIVGGATRSELRACHKLTTELKREIVLGSSSLDNPQKFIMKLRQLSAQKL